MDLAKDKKLIANARKDARVFGEIYEEYYPKIFRYVLRRVGNVGIAEDITSETFFKALESLWQFKWRNITFSAWLYKIATNEVNYYFRRGTFKAFSLELLKEKGFDPPAQVNIEAELDEAETHLQRHEDFLTIRKELEKLPERYQEVIALRFFENKKITEVSEILGKKEGTIKSLLSRGLDLLRRKLIDSQQNQGLQPFSVLNIIEIENNNSTKK
jgi:RNA polymerase sigma-70 factor (ECF subfamily)